MKEGRPTRVAILMTSHPVFVYIGQYIFFDIYVHWLGYIGAICIIIACIGTGMLKQETPINDELQDESKVRTEEEARILLHEKDG